MLAFPVFLCRDPQDEQGPMGVRELQDSPDLQDSPRLNKTALPESPDAQESREREGSPEGLDKKVIRARRV